MIDRFGLLPEALKNLIAVSELKQQAENLGIIKIDAGENGGKLDFSDKPAIKPETLIKLIQIKSRKYKLDGPTRLRFTLETHTPAERVSLIAEILQELSE